MRKSGDRRTVLALGLAGFGAGAIIDAILLTAIREGLTQAESLTAILAFVGALTAWLVRVVRRAPEPGSPGPGSPGSGPGAEKGKRKAAGAHGRRLEPAGNTERALAACAGCFLALAAFVADTPWSHGHSPTSDPRGHSSTSDPRGHSPTSNPRVLWRFPTHGAIEDRPAVADGRVVVGSEDDSIYGIDLASPHRYWQRSTLGTVLSSPVVADGVVYVGSGDGHLYALSIATGVPKWTYPTGVIGYASPVVAGGAVYIGTGPANGKGIMYRLRTDGTKLWQTPLDGQIQAAAAVADGKVYVGTTTGTFYALDATTGAVVWKYAMYDQGGDHATPVVSDQVVYVASGNGHLYALAAGNGHLVRDQPFPNWFRSGPALAGDMLYLGDMGQAPSYLYGIDTAQATGSWLVKLKEPLASGPAVADGVIYVGSEDHRLYAISAATHRQLWTFLAGGQVNSSPVVTGGVVYVGSDNGILYALRA